MFMHWIECNMCPFIQAESASDLMSQHLVHFDFIQILHTPVRSSRRGGLRWQITEGLKPDNVLICPSPLLLSCVKWPGLASHCDPSASASQYLDTAVPSCSVFLTDRWWGLCCLVLCFMLNIYVFPLCQTTLEECTKCSCVSTTQVLEERRPHT